MVLALLRRKTKASSAAPHCAQVTVRMCSSSTILSCWQKPGFRCAMAIGLSGSSTPGNWRMTSSLMVQSSVACRHVPPKPARDAFAVVERYVLFAALVAVVARVGDLALARRVPRPARADGEGDDRAGEGAQRAEGGEAAGRHDCTSPRSSASVACQFASASISSL